MTLFPEMCREVLRESIIGRAIKKEILEVVCHNIRDYSANKHNRVDDYPYGGGKGMVMACEPIYNCFNAVSQGCEAKPHLIYMSPKGKTLTQKKAVELSRLDRFVILCGHYEGVDQRVIDELVDEEISIGDYVLTGGELPALVLVDTVSRMLEGVLSDPECFTQESHFNQLLEHEQYTRPAVWRDKAVPTVLLSGNHAQIEAWRKNNSLETTKKMRPELLK